MLLTKLEIEYELEAEPALQDYVRLIDLLNVLQREYYGQDCSIEVLLSPF
jgi:hypothetical protein